MQNISRTISFALRHKPEAFNLTPDSAGWVEISDLIEQFNAQQVSITFEELMQIVSEDTKQRFSVNGSRIRANQGHSFPVELELENMTPPEFLFHGTVEKFLPQIFVEGLKPMQRHAVHLSENIDTATQVGSRRGEAIILRIQSGKMFEKGHTFQRSANNVWLTQNIPPQFITTHM